ncbi:ATP-binding cassette domain-containing protein [Dermacoccus abyssi]|uniref:ABC transporter ATP-binding protein n=1 Tax=Dermacoccus abyssi TaxID=322596 RepID=UPI0021A62FF1|nr:ATP-binding cassette domain-containing protein [Dermacoccus abyssi]MCT1985704.1 ATP-binding cassette domain-containing protein [Dermacoccus abyssi]
MTETHDTTPAGDVGGRDAATVWTREPAVVMEAATLTYDGAEHPSLRDVDLRIERGELVAVIGRTGSGKSTLLGLLTGLVPHFTGGLLQGRVVIGGLDISENKPSELASVVGYVGQDPLAGFVTDTVEEELAYGMEQLGIAPEVMRRRVEETLDLLGIAELREAPLRDLSGGQQQRVAIGSVLVMHPQILVLDEPTSALDPTAAEDVLAVLTRLVQDVGSTVVVAEHRIERVLPFADQVVHVGANGVVTSGAPGEVLGASGVAPPVVELGRAAGWSPLPLTIRDARRVLVERAASAPFAVEAPPIRGADVPSTAPVLEARGVRVRLSGLDVVAGVDLDLCAGTVTALMGRNGCGKSTLMWALQGSGRRDGGSVGVVSARGESLDPAKLNPAQRRGLVGMVPQTAGDLLYLDTVGEELAQADSDAGREPGAAQAYLANLAPGIDPAMHPRDLSEGQRLALVLAVQLVAEPQVLVLDEPTRGLDYAGKEALRAILRTRADEGRAVLVATHDVEFAAAVADEVIQMAGGEFIATGSARDVLTASPALAPQVAKVLAPVPALTLSDALTVLGVPS